MNDVHDDDDLNNMGRLPSGWWILPLLLVGLLLFATFFAGRASAQAVPAQANVSWTLPTTSVEGVPLTGTNALTAIEVYVSTTAIADGSSMAPTLTLAAGATSTTYTTTVTNGQTLYVRAKAVNASGKSAFGVQVSRLIQLSTVPGVPTSMTITLNIG